MLNLIKRYALLFAWHMAAAAAVLTATWLLVRTEIRPTLVFIAALTTVIVPLGPVLAVEQYEEKHRGYDILAPLPLRTVDIVGAKFGLAFTAGVAFTAGALLILAFSSGDPKALTISRSFVLLTGALGLVLSALIQIGVFALGFTRLMVVVLSGTAALSFVPLLLIQNNRMDVLIRRFLSSLEQMPRLPVLAVAVALYGLLLLVSVRVKEWRKRARLAPLRWIR